MHSPSALYVHQREWGQFAGPIEETKNFMAELCLVTSNTTVSKSAEPSVIPAMQFEDGSQLPEQVPQTR